MIQPGRACPAERAGREISRNPAMFRQCLTSDLRAATRGNGCRTSVVPQGGLTRRGTPADNRSIAVPHRHTRRMSATWTAVLPVLEISNLLGSTSKYFTAALVRHSDRAQRVDHIPPVRLRRRVRQYAVSRRSFSRKSPPAAQKLGERIFPRVPYLSSSCCWGKGKKRGEEFREGAETRGRSAATCRN